MNSMLSRILPSIGSLARRWESRFYLVLGLALGLFVIADFSLKGVYGARGADVDDQLLDWRLSSPRPSSDILIVDIDERSIERVGREQGRWPWTRAVLAEALANISEAGPKAVLLNVQVSELDMRDPAGDEALAEVAAAYDRLVFPFIRLSPSNDAISELESASIPGARPLGEGSSGPSTVAAVMPMFASLQRNTGASNLMTDSDGIVRRYQYWLPAGTHYLPSTVASVVRLAGGDVMPGEEQFSKLNWRNKRGDYTRVSFADLYEDMRGSGAFDWRLFEGKIVIIGASAPGISTIKPTAVATTVDDNTIIATAIDDALSGTALRVTSPLFGVVIALVMLALLSRAFLIGTDQGMITRVFTIGQTALVVVTFFSLSYSNFVIDLTLPFKVGLAYFAVAKTYYGAQHATERGFERFWDASRVREAETVMIMLFDMNRPGSRQLITKARRQLEREVTWEAVLHVNDFVDGRTFLGAGMTHVELLLAFLPRGSSSGDLKSVQLAKDEQFKVLQVSIKDLDERQCRAVVWRKVVDNVLPSPGDMFSA
jgi:CHASE2 domain-containing sensor protein